MARYEEFYEKVLAEEARERAEGSVHERPAGRGSMDMPFLLLTLLLLGIGLIMVLSASFARAYFETGDPTRIFVRQALFSVAGVCFMLLLSRFNINLIRRFSIPLLAVSLLLLAVVPFIGAESGGARRWIDLGFTTFQPSEIVKLTIILSFAAMACKYKGKMKTFRYGVLPFAFILVVTVALLMLEPHISAAIIIIAIGAVMMFIGGTKLQWFILGGIIVAAAGFLVLTKFDYAVERITIWRDRFPTPGRRIPNHTVALCHRLGRAFGRRARAERQKYLYLPEEHNDYIFSIVCEELGFIGALLSSYSLRCS